ncbi:hypothetical protein F1654_09215 [Alkalicaulis satelles]|uniref:DUF560 domain-containing protein n=1 Tax=Alkalicaulis satelles TaxID=2609175 RepID=A0A5M6ZI25_9PROT|nr:hypothetical protein [Alkalicaulis satelles]KAA5803960.1 hypothetical protein F1654_09215 [Alkalicaulis satelles]
MRNTIAAAGLALAASAAAEAQQGRFEFTSDTMIARDDPFAPDEALDAGPGGQPFGLATGFDSNNWARWVQPLSGRQVLRFEQQARVRSFFDRDGLDSVLLTPRIQYWNTTQDNTIQFRIHAAYSHLSRSGSTHWTRPEAEAQLRWRPRGDRTLETVGRLRLNAYDFRSAPLQGLSSTRVRAGLEQYWRAPDDAWEVRLSAFRESADADERRFSFDETRVGAGVSWRAGDRTTLGLAADYRMRDYRGAFSQALPVNREDRRLLAEARVERQISERASLFAAAGYLDNDSNIAARDYGGPAWRAGLRFRF